MKIFGWFGKLLFTTLFVCILSVTVTFFMVNMYAQQMLKSMGMDTDDTNLTFSNFLSQLSGQENTIKKEGQVIEAQDDKVQGNIPPKEVKDDAVEVWSQQSTSTQEQAKEVDKKEIVITLEEFNKTKDLLSDEDKMSVFSIVVSKIPPKEIQKLSLLMEDGITQEELDEIEKIIGIYLNEDEYDQMLAILNSYN